jgi:HAD superfamily hydrolase (TIGR01509 family)
MNTVLFDMDGVLLDSEIPSFERLYKTLRKKGIELSLSDLLGAYTGMNSNAIYASLIERFGLDQTVDEFRLEHYRTSGDYYSDGDLAPMPELIPFMEYLHANKVKMAVVSSSSSKSVLTALNRLSLIGYPGAIIAGDMVKNAKPSPEGYLAAAGYLQSTPADCLVIEDSPLGIQAAKNAGIFVIGFKGSRHRQDTSGADRETASYEELRQWFSFTGPPSFVLAPGPRAPRAEVYGASAPARDIPALPSKQAPQDRKAPPP